MVTFRVRVVRFLIWLLVLSWGLRLLRRIVGSMLRNDQASAPQTADPAGGVPASSTGRRLVRDPVCGTHVDETLFIPLREGGELLHFFFPACRDAYAGITWKVSANRETQS